MVYLCTPCIHTADYSRRFSEDALFTLFGIVAPPYQRETRHYSILLSGGRVWVGSMWSLTLSPGPWTLDPNL